MSFYVRPRSSFMRLAASFLLISTLVLLIVQLILYSRDRANFPAGLVVAGIPVGGISRQDAAERLLRVYNLPVELRYGDSVIHMDPAVAEFRLNLEGMIAAADQQRTSSPFWGGFWDYLWGNVSNPVEVPLDATYSEGLLLRYLNEEISARYDKAPSPAQPIAGTTQFRLGEPGTTINVDSAIPQIESALFSPTQRSVSLTIQQSATARPNLQNLQVQLQQIMEVAGYDGIADIYFQDLATGQEMHFIYRLGSNLPTQPDISFTAASLMKVPVMVSTFKTLDSEPDARVEELFREMIAQSLNEATDALMSEVVGGPRAPIAVTEDMRQLGLENTFLAGYFYLGAPLLERYSTPASQRSDVNTDPDPYNQTTPTDMGMLLSDIYQCAEDGGGTLRAVFPDQITQGECLDMLEILSQNRIGILIEAGVPEGTRVAHKHGWVTNPNTQVINVMSDAGVVFTPSGDYVLVISFYQPVQLIFDPISAIFSDISEAVYNYYTLPSRDE